MSAVVSCLKACFGSTSKNPAKKGLRKAKRYDWKDSNMFMFGSDTERQVKKAAAETEPAWEGAGTEVGLQIWRIVKFEVTHWDKTDYGKFYAGDSYIILRTYKKEPSDDLHYDLHFWIGSHSTQDEYGTAAYKTVELDTFLDDKAVQYREVQNHESEKFQNLFKEITIMEGGADTGFRHVEPEVYEPRLLRFDRRSKNVLVREVCRTKDSVKSDAVYILDLGLKVYQFIGKDSNKDERFKAAQYLQTLESDRGNVDSEILDEDGLSSHHEFWEKLDQDPDDEDDDEELEEGEKILYRLDSGEFLEVKTGDVSLEDFRSDDVFMLRTGKNLYVWIGTEASKEEKANGFSRAHNFASKNNLPPFISISVCKEGLTDESFDLAISA